MNALLKVIEIIIGLFLIILTSDLTGWKKNSLWVIIVILLISNIYTLYSDTKKEHALAKSGKLKSQKILSNHVQLYYGTNRFITPSDFLNDEILSRFINPWPKMNAYFRIVNGKILIDIDVKNKEGNLIARIKNNEWTTSNEAFDRNFDDNHFEVFDKKEDVPVLQVAFIKNMVVLNGVFYDSRGNKTIATTSGLTVNARESQKFTSRPWFKYPSGEHPGELDEDAVRLSLDPIKDIPELLYK